MQAFSRFLYFKVFRWTMEGSFPDVDKCVVAVVPHTHWMDFFLGLVVRSILGKEINYIAKKSLFKPPFGWFFRWTGGAPIDRSKTSNTVDSVAAIFKDRKVFRFALAPEGTRKKVTELKTGFYHIAKKAEVPIVLVAFDFGKKQVKFSQLLYPSNDMKADFDTIHTFFKGVVGKVPAYSF
ncbi:1-acyl-sn-glycerol-3-phosphate acyltransferase [Flagellimonas meridianipacifica]|uniref:1-acyl-sn-glycerol-3-phosphate acyltransferase n=1 Tax=Flagellimonas meridianipacifica TaxID=1080225 RepID=A0A2T0MD59_9FLAO|nr:1-acyl-sn-glycerol-3-phosphate acyltransferase [Allomuricauda pacifica]PRX55429.1 1-acyl-sn-glycerol-3-phosphate acyltransferase [Allomuricauda pacifica]